MCNRWGIVVLVALAAAAPASAEEWQKTYTVKETPAVSIGADDASVEIRSWKRNEVSVRVVSDRGISLSSGNGDLLITENQSGNAISVALRERRAAFRIQLRWKETRVEVRVPERARLDIRTEDGSIDAANVEGDCMLHTGDGSIRAEGLSGHMQLETADGSIRGSGLAGDVLARSGDGRIEVYGTFRRLELMTSDGTIVAGAGPESAPGKEGWRIRTGDGTITLRFPAKLAVSLDARTDDGRIRMHFEDAVRREIERRSARVDLNGGGPPIHVRSGDGSIRIERF
jgi:DUF4097 and DUF4098 domain-containing protein YvlB